MTNDEDPEEQPEEEEEEEDLQVQEEVSSPPPDIPQGSLFAGLSMSKSNDASPPTSPTQQQPLPSSSAMSNNEGGDANSHSQTPKLSNLGGGGGGGGGGSASSLNNRALSADEAVGAALNLPPPPLDHHHDDDDVGEKEEEEEAPQDMNDNLLGRFQSDADADADSGVDAYDTPGENETTPNEAELEAEAQAQATPEAPAPEAPKATSMFGGWFGGASAAPAAPAAVTETLDSETLVESETAAEDKPEGETSAEDSPPVESATTTATVTAVEANTETAAPETPKGMFGGWFGGSPAAAAPATAAAATPETTAAESESESATKESQAAPYDETPSKTYAAAAASATRENGDEPVEGEGEGEEGKGEGEGEEETLPVSKKKELDPQDHKALDDAFHEGDGTPTAGSATATGEAGAATATADTTVLSPTSRARSRPRPRGLGEIHPDTPVPNSDVALNLLRKFAYKTRPKIISTYGGSKSKSIMAYLFGAKEDSTFTPYRDLMDALYEEGEDRDMKDDSERVVEAVLGETGDSMAKARGAVASFVYLFSVWGHASSRFFEQKDTKSQQAFSELLSASFDCASHLVAHGCLDGVEIGMGDIEMEYIPAVHMLAQSVFNSDLTIERNELTAMKFLLSTGCRTAANGDSMLRGSHLLQTIRVLYHVYLTTEFSPNKTTARAALQQLVTSVFVRVVKTDHDEEFEKTADNFPSQNHRDAFLVMRSICKLSMRNLPDPSTGMVSHVGLNTSGSNDMWDGSKESTAKSGAGEVQQEAEEHHHEQAHLVNTAAIHPALESKILALELLLYVLHNTEFSRGFIHRSGAQFHTAIRNYLCVSLLKNCTSGNTRVVNLSLRIFVPLVRSFRAVLKNEIEAFVTNVFFVILDSKNSPVEHKSIVVKTFDEICSDPATLAEIFLNYDCDLSAVDLFHRIVNTLSRVSRTGVQEPKSGALSFMGGPSAARLEKFRIENRDLRLDAMRALRQVLASLHASIVEPMPKGVVSPPTTPKQENSAEISNETTGAMEAAAESPSGNGQQNLVEIYGSKKKRRAEEAEVILRFNQKPSAGLKYAVKCQHVDGDDPVDVARYLLKNKDTFEKTMIGECMGREAEYQNGFNIKVLHEYVRLLDFAGLGFDEAMRFFLSGFRLPGEAQKIDRIMEKFAERYTEQNPDVFPTADVAFILAFSIIMLNTDLHNPAIKEDRRMTKEGFVRNNRGICDGQDLPEQLLTAIFDRIKANPISLKEDDEARERAAGDAKSATTTGLPAALSPASFFSSHYDDMDRARQSNFQKEQDHIVRTTESLLKRRRHLQDHGKALSKSRIGKTTRHSSKFVRTEDSGLRDEYVSPMFDVAWGPALAAFSTAIESANGTVGSLVSVASDEELELAAENAAETIEVCMTGFRFAIGTAGICGNDTARDAYMLALGRFSQLGTGVLLEPRHVRCIQTMLSLAREDGELLGNSWDDVFKALSEINRFHQLFHSMARSDRAAAAATARRRRQLEEKEKKRIRREELKAAAEDEDSIAEEVEDGFTSDTDDSLAESDIFSDEEDFEFEENMDSRAIDHANARTVYDAVSEAVIEAIYERSSSLSAPSVKDFVLQLCLVSRMEISVGGYKGHGAGGPENVDVNQISYRQQHALLNKSATGDQFHHSQPNIYNLQKLVEVMHYNMDTRPRLIFADLWTIVAGHLTGTALHSNPAIAMYAVDSFRQLSIQYLQRDELEVFEFQRRFLKPLETIMAKSEQVSTKELLLNCVDRIMQVFRTDSKDLDDTEAGLKPKGGLRSGWVPILTILGFGGRDRDEGISRMSFKILSDEVNECLDDVGKAGVLLAEHFVETVNALLMFVSGLHEEVSLLAIDQLVSLARFLVDDSFAPPQLKRRPAPSATSFHSNDAEVKQELELWWPILLGLSKAVGDSRVDVRSKGLDTLVGLIENHFFPSENSPAVSLDDDPIQTLQLIFRGILTPMLEFSEIGSQEGQLPRLPPDFERFLNLPKVAKVTDGGAVEETAYTGWLETMFDPFMDACISICLRATRVFEDESFVEEIFAILNNCLLSDSGTLAVRGMWRLEQFVTSDLDPSLVTDGIWATTSHMLRRCLSVRGLPSEPRPAAVESTDEQTDEFKAEEKEYREEYAQEVREFVLEDNMLSDRRYVGGNATTIIGLLLTSDRFSEAIGLRWRLFLIAGLGRAIADWERAASLLVIQNTKVIPALSNPPDYRETALYGRKWMNRFVLQLASMKDVVQNPVGENVKTDRAKAQTLVLDETQRLLSGFLVTERAASQYRATEEEEAFHSRFLALVKELLTEYNNMEPEHLKDMHWINPVLLSSCIQSKNGDIRGVVQKLVQRTAPVLPSPAYPAPPAVVAKVKPSILPSVMPADVPSEATDVSSEVTDVPSEATYQDQEKDVAEVSPSETNAEVTPSVDLPASLPEGEADAVTSNGSSPAESSSTELEEFLAEEPEPEPVESENSATEPEEYLIEEPEPEPVESEKFEI